MFSCEGGLFESSAYHKTDKAIQEFIDLLAAA
jgi:hypothetical protein